jgi:hypothetical protein
LIFCAEGIKSTLQVNFSIVFLPTGFVEFCWLLIGSTRIDQKNSMQWDQRTMQFVCSICYAIFKGWGQRHDGGFVGRYFHLATYNMHSGHAGEQLDVTTYE